MQTPRPTAPDNVPPRIVLVLLRTAKFGPYENNLVVGGTWGGLSVLGCSSLSYISYLNILKMEYYERFREGSSDERGPQSPEKPTPQAPELP